MLTVGEILDATQEVAEIDNVEVKLKLLTEETNVDRLKLVGCKYEKGKGRRRDRLLLLLDTTG